MKENPLNEIEIRILGALMEKEMATPEYYPLTLNALTNACNQKSNRDPVYSLEEVDVVKGLNGLKDKRMVVQSDVSRVPKYEQIFARNLKLINREAALVCLLLLRGPQTVGELRGRSERLYSFDDLGEVEQTLQDLAEMELVRKLPRQPGRKESRYVQLLAGGIDEGEYLAETSRPEAATLQVKADNERLDSLESEVSALKEELAGLQKSFEEFKAQFE